MGIVLKLRIWADWDSFKIKNLSRWGVLKLRIWADWDSSFLSALHRHWSLAGTLLHCRPQVTMSSSSSSSSLIFSSWLDPVSHLLPSSDWLRPAALLSAIFRLSSSSPPSSSLSSCWPSLSWYSSYKGYHRPLHHPHYHSDHHNPLDLWIVQPTSPPGQHLHLLSLLQEVNSKIFADIKNGWTSSPHPGQPPLCSGRPLAPGSSSNLLWEGEKPLKPWLCLQFWLTDRAILWRNLTKRLPSDTAQV